MGLLDALNYSGQPQGGGLLDFFLRNALNQQPVTGLASDQAQYGQPTPMQATAQMQPQMAPATPQRNAQPSPMDGAQWPFGPMGAPSQANAQMQSVPQQPPPVISAPAQVQTQQPPPSAFGGGSYMDRLNNGGGLISSLFGDSGQQQAQNVTRQWLQQRGVDPATASAAMVQPELLKSLIDETKTKPVQALGSGYIWDAKQNKAVRAYEPDEKTPAGFEKLDNGTMRAIPGGPADPAYLRLAEAQKKDPSGNYVLGRGGEVVKNNPDGSVTVLHKNEADLGPGLSSDALDIQARQEAGGDFSGRKNMGRGAQSAKDLQELKNRAARVLIDEYGMTPTEAAAHMSKKYQEFNAQGVGLNAEARTTGVREANLNLILKAADAAIPAALEASDKVARTGWVPLNNIIQHGEVMTSNPELKKFGMANLQLAEHWARAMNPTGVMRESDRDKALEFLSTKDSKETYKEAVGQLRTQIERERDAVRSTRGMATMPGAAPETTPSPGGAPKAGNYVWMPGKGLVAQ